MTSQRDMLREVLWTSLAQSNKNTVAHPPKPASLRDRFTDWYGSLPPVSRDRRFSMSEIAAGLKTQGRYISPVLLDLGWKRKRVWSTTGQYHRYWEPPPTGAN